MATDRKKKCSKHFGSWSVIWRHTFWLQEEWWEVSFVTRKVSNRLLKSPVSSPLFQTFAVTSHPLNWEGNSFRFDFVVIHSVPPWTVVRSVALDSQKNKPKSCYLARRKNEEDSTILEFSSFVQLTSFVLRILPSFTPFSSNSEKSKKKNLRLQTSKTWGREGGSFHPPNPPVQTFSFLSFRVPSHDKCLGSERRWYPQW